MFKHCAATEVEPNRARSALVCRKKLSSILSVLPGSSIVRFPKMFWETSQYKFSHASYRYPDRLLKRHRCRLPISLSAASSSENFERAGASPEVNISSTPCVYPLEWPWMVFRMLHRSLLESKSKNRKAHRQPKVFGSPKNKFAREAMDR